jgi:hypothetical protein
VPDHNQVAQDWKAGPGHAERSADAGDVVEGQVQGLVPDEAGLADFPEELTKKLGWADEPGDHHGYQMKIQEAS